MVSVCAPLFHPVAGAAAGARRWLGITLNSRDKNLTERKLKARMEQIEESVARYLTELGQGISASALLRNSAVHELYAFARAIGGCKARVGATWQIGSHRAGVGASKLLRTGSRGVG